jgi:hypothetical protein
MAIGSPLYELSKLEKDWASKGRQGLSPMELRDLLIKQEGRCALSRVPLNFEKKLGTPKACGLGCHPLYPAVDHIQCGTPKGRHQIVCYTLNDVKGHLPLECFKALKSTKAWKRFMEAWKSQAEKDSRKSHAPSGATGK